MSTHCFNFGGYKNANYSAILGGANNNDMGLNNVFIAGSGINAVNVNSLHIEGLWSSPATGITGPGTALPPGSVYWDHIGTCACKVLMIV